MNRCNPLLITLGAGLAIYRAWTMRQRARSAQRWHLRRANQPGAGTAFITGASSGIGEAFARALAHDGYNLVLASRREERLNALAEKIRRSSPVRIDVLRVDLSDPAGIERAASVIQEIPDLELLVNNAGFGLASSFVESDAELQANMIRLHVEAPVRLARAAIPGMIERQQGAVINVASIAALVALPGNVLYGTTKAGLRFFSDALRKELAGSGVQVQALLPGFTYSEFHDVIKMNRAMVPGFMWMPAHQVVEESLKGLREGIPTVIPGRLYRLMALALSLPMVDRLAQIVQEWRLARSSEL